MQTTPELSSAAPATSAPPTKRGWQLPRLQEAGLLVVILIIGAVLALLAEPVRGENGFLRPGNLIPSVFTVMSWIGVMAIGVTVVIITGGIDISVGSIMGLAALGCAAALLKLPENAPMWQVLPVGVGVPLLIGAICGLINGGLVVGLRMHPFIVTLGTLSIFRGIALVSVREGSLPPGDRVLPAAFTDRFVAWTTQFTRSNGRAEFFQPVPMIIMLLIMGLGWLYLRWMIWGRETYAIGGNEEAARFSGIPVGWVKMRAYLISGVCAGIAGMLTCGYYKSAATNTGLGYELMVIAAAVVGGASLSGGRGTALGAILGTLIIQMIDDGISILSSINLGFTRIAVSKEYTQIIVGVAIVLAVAVDRFSEYLRQRRLAGRGVKG
jgi:ribose/xylose/arabinose/galactoside ABC-type transport system permease subunit